MFTVAKIKGGCRITILQTHLTDSIKPNPTEKTHLTDLTGVDILHGYGNDVDQFRQAGVAHKRVWPRLVASYM
jgi:hypothetical protein